MIRVDPNNVIRYIGVVYNNCKCGCSAKTFFANVKSMTVSCPTCGLMYNAHRNIRNPTALIIPIYGIMKPTIYERINRLHDEIKDKIDDAIVIAISMNSIGR